MHYQFVKMKRIHKTTQKIIIEKDYLRAGDLQKIATRLKVSYNRVREVSVGRQNDSLIAKTINKLNKARAEQGEVLSEKVSKELVSSN